MRTVTPLQPAEIGLQDGLSYSLWLPQDGNHQTHGGVVILHGAGSCKESHHDFARAALAVYDVEFTRALRHLQQSYLDRSEVLDLTVCRARSAIERFTEDTARLVGPLL